MTDRYCFCTLALGDKYHVLAKKLIESLNIYAQDVKLLVLTDKPSYFSKIKNVLAYKCNQKGILKCCNDKRFAIERSLSSFDTAVYVDADSKFIETNKVDIVWNPGIEGFGESLIKHVDKYRPERLKYLANVADKLSINLESVKWIGESLFAVTKDNGKEKDFIKQWGLIGNYLEINGIHDGEGASMGLAAEKVGWKLKSDNIAMLKGKIKHIDASGHRRTSTFSSTFLGRQKRRFKYHFRLNIAKLKALKDFNFYYR